MHEIYLVAHSSEVVDAAGGEVVEHHNRVPPGDKGVDEVAPNKSGSSGDEYAWQGNRIMGDGCRKTVAR